MRRILVTQAIMNVRKSLGILCIGFLSGLAFNYINGPSIRTLGTDFIPPVPQTVSLRISGIYSNGTDFHLVDREMEKFMRSWEIAGASLAVAHNGTLIYAKGYGYADVESGEPVQPYHLFRIASVSKLVTAAGIMKLAEEGRLSLEDNVFGPNGILNISPFDNYKDKRVEEIKVKHLLNHSGGWTNRWGDPMFMPTVIAQKLGKELPVSDEDIIRFMLGKRLHFKPGTSSSYSNLGYVILGKVIEAVSGQSYEDYIKTAILYPLEIYDMQLGYSFPEQKNPLEVRYYEPSDSEPVVDFMNGQDTVPRSYGGNDIYTLGAAGGWIASSTDLMKLMLALDGNPEPADILSPESIKQMITPVDLGFQPFGWRGVIRGELYRTGTLAGTSALMVSRPDGYCYVVLLNTSTWKGPKLANEIRRMMHKGISKTEVWNEFDLVSSSEM